MPLNPGNDLVTFNTQTWNASPDRLGVTGPVSTSHNQTGCFMQPISDKDHITDTYYSEATWKCISPATTVTKAIKAEDTLTFQGVNYRILGVKPYEDFWGRLLHITFMVKEENG